MMIDGCVGFFLDVSRAGLGWAGLDCGFCGEGHGNGKQNESSPVIFLGGGGGGRPTYGCGCGCVHTTPTYFYLVFTLGLMYVHSTRSYLSIYPPMHAAFTTKSSALEPPLTYFL